MGKYGETAVRAVGLLRSSRTSAEDAWRRAAAEVFPDSPEARAKVCPRETFLGLVQQGLVNGAEPDRCTPAEANKNRTYALAAAQLLARDPNLAAASKADLWRRVMKHVSADPEKQHNQQLDVVLTLRESGLVITSSRVPNKGLQGTLSCP